MTNEGANTSEHRILARPARLFRYRSINEFLKPIIVGNEFYFSNYRELNDPLEGVFSYKKSWDREEALSFVRAARGIGPPSDALSKQFPPDALEMVRALNALPEDQALEFYMQALENVDIEAVATTLIRAQETTVGVCCLSESGRSPLLSWNYADRHRGVVLEFDTQAGVLARTWPIQYKNATPVFSIFDSPYDIQAAMFFSKGKDWEPEREWRVVNHVEAEKKVLPLHREALVSVAFCPRISDSDRQVVYNLLSERALNGLPPVRLLQLQNSRSQYDYNAMTL